MKKISWMMLMLLICTNLNGQEFSSDLMTDKKPWTSLDFYNNPDNFQFAIVTDRTGSPRPGIFEDAVRKLNWLMPEFVISVGDLIRGASGQDSITLEQQWSAHFERISPLKMPFFHLAGNHDIKANNQFQVEYWNRLFGAPFYSFVYKNVLFLCLFSNEGTQILSEEQIRYFEQVLGKNKDVRWTMVFMHHPLWRYPHDSNFDDLEKLLADRKYTVYAGHQHRYHHSEHHDKNYYVLATTGGGSGLLGNNFGEFDHMSWITMSDHGPVMANLRLDGILPHDISNDQTTEMAKNLLDAVHYEQQVMVNKGETFTNGKAFLTFENASAYPIHLKGKFYHSHQVSVKPDAMESIIEPHAQKTIALDLIALEQFPLEEDFLLEFDATLSFDPKEFPGFELSGKKDLLLKPTKIEMFSSDYIAFVDDYELEITTTIPGAQIFYTLDGSDPTPASKLYSGPLQIDTDVTISAMSLKDGFQSPVDKTQLVMVKGGKGVLCKFYESEESWYTLTDFSENQPNWVKVMSSLKLDEVTAVITQEPFRKKLDNEAFGLIYSGYIDLPENGEYTFNLSCDDAASLWIAGQEVIADPVKHKERLVTNKAMLKKGKQPFELRFFQHRKELVLELSYETPSGKKVEADDWKLSF